MFGYIRPNKGELKVKEFERFQSVYCGLCHTLRREFGIPARFVLNYDFTFLAMLLSEGESVCQNRRRCPASPFRKKCCIAENSALSRAAAYSVILMRWKLCDSLADEGFGKRLVARAALLLLSGAYRKAKTRESAFDAVVCEKLKALAALEQEGCASLDHPADCFASLLAAAAEGSEEETRKRILQELLYQMGRLIYLTDAADDLADDCKHGRYNPLRARYALSGDCLTEESRAALETTLRHSQNRMISAFRLLPPNGYQAIEENILCEGIPLIVTQVLNGTWQKKSRKK